MNWKDIEGYEGLYKISDTGIVKSYDKIVEVNGGYRLHKGKTKCIYVEKSRMQYHSISLSDKGINKSYRIHRLVAKTFISNPNNYPNVLHNDNDTSNNCVSNLRWGTQKDNLQQMSRENRWSNQYYISIA
jgi:hypothetical protein